MNWARINRSFRVLVIRRRMIIIQIVLGKDFAVPPASFRLLPSARFGSHTLQASEAQALLGTISPEPDLAWPDLTHGIISCVLPTSTSIEMVGTQSTGANKVAPPTPTQAPQCQVVPPWQAPGHRPSPLRKLSALGAAKPPASDKGCSIADGRDRQVAWDVVAMGEGRQSRACFWGSAPMIYSTPTPLAFPR